MYREDLLMTHSYTIEGRHTVYELLRKKWEQQLRGLSQDASKDDIRLRVHRSLSWLDRAEELRAQDGESSEDDQLVFTWTALNSLYGYWLPEKKEPAPDIQSLERFLDTLFELDRQGYLAEFTSEHQALILEVFNNQFLAKQFWNSPTIEAANRRTNLGREANTWFIESRHRLILDKLLRNVYYLRCQLIHGAATRRSSLNRDTVRGCLGVLRLLAPVMLRVVIENGLETDWGPACYPVVK
jgi:hypothetical protein